MINKEDLSTVNVTLKVINHSVTDLENWLKDNFDLIDFRVMADTDAMNKEDKLFKNLVKQRKQLKDMILDYIMKNNHKYDNSKTSD